MRTVLAVAFLLVVFAAPALGQSKPAKAGGGDAVKSALVALEKGAWEAWSKKDTNYFRTFLADDAISTDRNGVAGKAETLRFVGENKCEIRGYALDDASFRVTMIDPNAAILSYKATQDYTCEGRNGPTPVYVSAVYARRGGKWVNVSYQETQAEK